MAKWSKVTEAVAADFCRTSSDDEMISVCLSAAKSFVLNQTGLKEDEVEDYEDLSSAVLLLCADMYDNRSYSVSNSNSNKIVDSILAHHRRNLL